MRIAYKENTRVPISVKDFLIMGEYDQNDTALISYDDLYDYLEKISVPKITNETKTNPVGRKSK